jgi:hypothetical protein
VTRNDPQSEVLAFLADTATHGLAPGSVRHLRTHISDVFLAGDYAYKIKRAVRYSFVDFTTPEARRAACAAEVALNRRTASGIYLGTVAIRRAHDGSLSLGRLGEDGPGTPVEWAVVMRRFDEHETLDQVAERGALDVALIDRLVDEVAALHAAAEAHLKGFGGADALNTVIDQNVEDMAHLTHILAPERVASLTATTRAAHNRQAALLDGRRDNGFVRRCHGDLHLANAVMWQGRPVLFDCIEFSEAIATVDVVYDLAFLLMDLEVRGLRPLANRAMGRYFGRTGGTDALAALSLMLSLRAAVRAKVSAMAADGEEDPDRKQAAAATANTFLDAAQRFLRPPPTPRLVAVGGLSGAGKTTLGGRLAPLSEPAPGALHVRSDVIRKRLAGVAPEDRLPPQTYAPETSAAVYREMLNDTGPALAGGYSVVLDGVFARPEERRAAEALAARAGVPFHGLWLDAPAATLRARVKARRGDASDATTAVVERQTTYDTGEISWTRVDADGDPDAVLDRARAALERTG